MEELTAFDRILEIVTAIFAIIFSIGSVILSFIIFTADEYDKPLFNENWLFLLYAISVVSTLIAAWVESNNYSKYCS